MKTAADCRLMWDAIERLWSDTVTCAERLPEPALHERVDGEWSFVETLRHLVFITDAWASRPVRDEPMPYHRLGITQTAYAPADAAALGIDLDERPSLACPYPRTARVLRMRWVLAYTGAGGRVGVEGPAARARARARRWWNGPDDD